jgi:hypothetical protein
MIAMPRIIDSETQGCLRIGGDVVDIDIVASWHGLTWLEM